MMKKIFALVLMLVLGKISYSQYPLQQNLGSDSTIVISKGALQSRLINVTYTDTAAANLQRIRQYPGAQIATTSGGINLWVRNANATAWLPINTGSGNNIYTINGTLTGNRTLTGGGYPLTFTGLDKFVVSADSVRFTTGDLKFGLNTDSASLTKKISYSGNYRGDYKQFTLVDKGYVDSVVASSPAGTVTSIATNNGSGITGGTITSTGTLAIDTTNVISTKANVTSGLAGKLNISDTAAMLNPYLRKVDTASLSNRINQKLNISDTASMLGNYINNVGYGLSKAGQVVLADSATLSAYYLRRKDSLTATNSLGYVTKKILADTAAAIRASDAGGSVTSVATNNGTGITGGTITTSGTLAIDTTVISTRAWRQKGVDSLQANINQKLNISDTAAMLSPYLRSNTAATTYVPLTRNLTINGTTQNLSADRTFNVGTVTSVALTMPVAFNVAGSPVTSSGTFAVTGAGLASQYIRGDGTLANFPGGGGGGGSSVSYYLNGSINQGTFGGNTYYQMNKTPVIGAGTNFTIGANGYIAQFITNAGDPALLNIPAGNWNFEMYFSASSGGGNPQFYVELYKYDGTTFTLIASGAASPESITGGTVKDLYLSPLAVPATSLTLTDRLAVRVYVLHDGRTITLHTEDQNLCQVITTFTTGITAINSLTAQVQYLTTGTSGTDFNISSLTDTHTFNLPVASATNTGKLSSANWTTFNNKIGPSDTASMLLPYLRKADTTSMLANYVNNVGYGLLKSGQVVRADSATLANYFLRRKDSLTSTNLLGYVTRKILADTAAAIRSADAGGTVTSVATNTNTGITGGTITTAGTLAIDTITISTRRWRQKGVDSVQGNLTAGLALKLNISDTSSMLSPYLRKVDTASLSNRINQKLNISDTATMLGNYVNNVGYGLLKSGQVVRADSATLANYFLRRKDSLTSTNLLGYVTRKVLADTAAAIRSADAGGTVTSVATNNGTGITGGTITTAGTLAIDTVVISTRAWRQKGVDSLQANINLKLNISDTASMLSPYLRKVDTASLSNRINTKLNISDTSSMLTNYLNNVGYGLLRTGQVARADSATLASYFLRRKDSLTSTNLLGYVTRKVLADTAAAIRSADAGGTVTSVATNNGTGITGGTITTAGTLSIDTTLISTRAWRQKGVDSLQANINLKLNISDTASMLSPYLRTNTAAATYVPQTRTITINGTTQDLTANRTYNVGTVTSVGATAGTGISVSGSPITSSGSFTITNTAPDQTVVLNNGTGISVSGTYPNFTITNTSPSSGGTVTSVGSGTGLSGGPITTSGTLSVDTLLMSTRAWRQKGIDSVQGNLTTGLAGKVNISDTAAMLTPYLRKIDTTAMLTPYLRANVAAATYVPQSRTITINGTSQDLSANRTFSVGTVTSVGITAGTGISVANSPVTGSGNITVTNTAPDQTVSLSAGSGISISGTYPSFTITNSSPSSGGTVTSVGSGTGLTGGPITTSGTLAVDTNLISTRLWRQKGVDSVAALANTKVSSVSGTSPISSSGGTSPTISISQASGSTNGFLSSTDWTTFNNKQNALTNPVTGTGTTDYIPKFTSSSAIGNSAIYDASGSIGIGTTAPGSKLEIKGGSGNQLVLNNGGETFTQQYWQNNGTNIGAIWASLTDFSIYTYSSQPIIFWTNGSERMRLDASGNLGLGTSSASGSYRLTLNGDASTNTGGILIRQSGTDVMYIGNVAGSNTTDFEFWNPRNGYTRFATNNIERMRLDASGNLGLGVSPSAWASGFTALQVKNASLWSTGSDASITANAYYDGSNYRYIASSASSRTYHNTDGSISWSQAPSGTAGNAISFTQAMTLDASGRLGIGTTSPAYKLDVAGSISNNSAQNIIYSSYDDVAALFQRVGAYGAVIRLGRSGVSNSTTIDYPADGTFAVSTSGNERMRITSGGNVGIGTTNPNSLLVVNGASSSPIFRVTGGGDGSGGGKGNIRSSDQGGTNFWDFGRDNLTTGNFMITPTSGTPSISITSGGNVGIGTTSPNTPLSIVANHVSGQSILKLQPTTAYASGGISSIGFNNSDGTRMGLVYQNSDGLQLETTTAVPIILNTNASERMRITSGGELLINTTTDAGDYKLQVNGQGYFTESGTTSGIYINNSTATNFSKITFNNSGASGRSMDIGLGGSTSSQPNTFYIYDNTAAATRMTINSSGNTEFGGSIKTAAPAGYTAREWKLGEKVDASVSLDQDKYIAIDIGGTVYYLALVKLN